MSAMQIGLLALYFLTVLLLAWPLAVLSNWIDKHFKFRAYERAMSQPYRSERERYRDGDKFTFAGLQIHGGPPDGEWEVNSAGKVRRIDTANRKTTRKATK